jgi:PIN domain nuclease of toxin-antitoxin system
MLDTHVLVWALADDARLGRKARAAIEESVAKAGVLVSAITPWEIAMLAQKGRLVLGRETAAWIDAALAVPGIRLAALEPAIAIDSVRLPGEIHADPADRIIIATARFQGVALLTADRAILDYGAAGHVTVLDAGQ